MFAKILDLKEYLKLFIDPQEKKISFQQEEILFFMKFF
jgi:hypothetical protein